MKRSSSRRLTVVALLLGKLLLGIFTPMSMTAAMGDSGASVQASAEHCADTAAKSGSEETSQHDGANNDLADCCQHHGCDCAGMQASALVPRVRPGFCVRSPCLVLSGNFDGVTQLQVTSVFRPPA